MKKFICLLFCFVMLLSATGCDNFLAANENILQGSVDLPEDGIVPESTVQQIKDENAVAVFCGQSGAYRYEWTVFGSDIAEVKALNLGLDIDNAENGIYIDLHAAESFGFAPVLSVYLDTQWDCQTATVYKSDEKTPLCSASVTGEKTSILNFAVTEVMPNLLITPDEPPATPAPTASGSSTASDRVVSDGKQTEQDKYKTDPVPAGKPMPVEPENTTVDKRTKYTCTFSIECSTILNNLDMLDPDKLDAVPSDGIILPAQTVTFYEGESVYDVLKRICAEKGIHMEASFTPMYNSAYVEGIHNLYEFDCGQASGWMYRVDGWYPNYGCSRYQLKQGETVEWRYTCAYGDDIGGGYAMGSD